MQKYCTDCGTGHDCASAQGGPSDAVQLARIDADARVKIAELEHSASAAVNEMIVETAEIEATTEQAVAEVEAEAGVEAAEAVAEAVTEVLAPEPDPAPAIVVTDEQTDATELPERDDREHQAPPPAEPKHGFF